ncbi:Acetyl esterase/lipase [Neorhodopirellula lusitana]|uniref:Acetyl esterase/lipase n=2 Tax=Neorhodopirellula lusitana TaxID=445327 RepID=A0ABY1Q292_9BACT|nr:Acetyl esterase/lipase [Neorhodopirellula lusitana]
MIAIQWDDAPFTVLALTRPGGARELPDSIHAGTRCAVSYPRLKLINMKSLLLVFASLLIPTLATADNLSPDETMTYKSIDGVELKLHCFQPDGHQASDHSPAIVFFFGGGWNGGSPKQFYQQARTLADRGMVAFSADYRVKSRNKTTPFECVKDGKSAIRWVRQHASELGIDPDRIVAAGGSAGGHVAACTGVIQGHDEPGEDLSVSSVPNAMVLFNPVLDTTPKGYGHARFAKDQKTEISPCHHVRAGIVPTYLAHGTADTTVPFENAERFTRLMREAGNRCELSSFEDQKHGFFNSPNFRTKSKDDSIFQKVQETSLQFLESLGYLTEAQTPVAN